jgi:hypothetical protein
VGVAITLGPNGLAAELSDIPSRIRPPRLAATVSLELRREANDLAVQLRQAGYPRPVVSWVTDLSVPQVRRAEARARCR